MKKIHSKNYPQQIALAVATILSAPNVSFAQQAAAAGGLEEIVVTATRRAESIRDVPISISAFSQAQMDIQGMKGVDDIARLAPGIQFERGGGFGSDLRSTISIRGVRSTAGAATTGVYIDDTPIQVGSVLASGNFTDNAYPQLFDVERVEVLRGPQGTLFGSGSEGGTIRFITPSPSLTKSSAYVRSELSTTQYGAPSYEFGAAGGTPLIEDKLGVRASIWTRRDGGYVDAVDYYTGTTTQANNNWTETFSARFAVGWSPIENLLITPSVFFQRVNSNGAGTFFLPSDGLTGTAPGLNAPLPVFQQPYGDVPHGNYVDIHQALQFSKQRLTLPALKVSYSFSKFDLLSNTSYFERAESGQTDFGAFQAGVFAGVLYPNRVWNTNPIFEHQTDRYFTQEIRLQSTDKTSPLQWVVGGFYSRTHTGFDRSIYDPYLGEMIAVGPFGNGCHPASACVLQRFGQPLHEGLYPFVDFAQVQESQKAAFGQVDYNLPFHLVATAGVRYARLTTDFQNAYGGAASGVPFPTMQYGHAVNSATTPKYMLSYKPGDGALVYASATKGFRNGGANAAISSRASCLESLNLLGLSDAPPTFRPDSVWSYELGTKFTTDQGRLQIDASVFEIDWKDQIRNLRLANCSYSFTGNVGTVQSRGFDFAVQWRALDALVLSLNGGYQFVKATETVALGKGAQNAVTNGDALPGSQPSVNAAAQYSFNALDKPSYLRVDVNYTGRSARDDTFNSANSSYNKYQLFENPGFTQTNARLGMQLDSWDISLFCNNLFNAQPILNETRAMLTFYNVPSGLLSANTLRPRTAGVTAVYRF